MECRFRVDDSNLLEYGLTIYPPNKVIVISLHRWRLVFDFKKRRYE